MLSPIPRSLHVPTYRFFEQGQRKTGWMGSLRDSATMPLASFLLQLFLFCVVDALRHVDPAFVRGKLLNFHVHFNTKLACMQLTLSQDCILAFAVLIFFVRTRDPTCCKCLDFWMLGCPLNCAL